MAAGPIRGVPGGTHAPPSAANVSAPAPAVLDYERTLIPVKLASAPVSPLIPEQKIYSTKRRWRACDVFIQVPNDIGTGAGAIVTIAVYANTQGVRSLLTTGRLNAFQAAGGESPRQFWICAARAECDFYEVTITSSYVPNGAMHPGNVQPVINVAIVASDQAVLAPDAIGCIGLQTAGADAQGDALGSLIELAASAEVLINPNAAIAHPPGELVSVDAINAIGATRFLLLFDPAHSEPKFGWALLAGTSVHERANARSLFGSPQSRGFFSGIQAKVTTTPKSPYTAAAAGDVTFQVWWR